MSPQRSLGYGEISTGYKAECLAESPWGKWESKKEIYTFHLVVILILCNFTSLGPLKDKNVKYVLPEGSSSCLHNMFLFEQTNHKEESNVDAL